MHVCLPSLMRARNESNPSKVLWLACCTVRLTEEGNARISTLQLQKDSDFAAAANVLVPCVRGESFTKIGSLLPSPSDTALALKPMTPYRLAYRDVWRRARQFFYVSCNAREILRPKGQRHVIRTGEKQQQKKTKRKYLIKYFAALFSRKILCVGQGRFNGNECPLALPYLSTSRPKGMLNMHYAETAKRNY